MSPADGAMLKRIWEAQSPRLRLWLPLPLMLGIGVYFTLPEEPPVWLGALVFAAAFLCTVLLWQRRVRIVAIAACMLALGFACAQARTYFVATPLVSQELYYRHIEGTIDEIQPVENKVKLVLSAPVIENLAADKTPARVRVSFRDENLPFRVGDRVSLHASLFPLPQPSMPGAYNFARHFYFQSIGASGFAMRAPELVDISGQSGWPGQWHEAISNLRHAIGEDMRAHMSKESGTVAAAMTIGEMGPIPEEVKEVLRNSGLAHILSISGLHLGIVTGIVFYHIRLLLSLWPTLALRAPVKKISALLALAGAFAYLMLAGAPIPAQRSFVMVAFLFIAMMLDRRGITLHTLSLTAVMLLILFPESMFGASFQMSFAATLAIVALYESTGRRLGGAHTTMFMRLPRYILAIAITSLAATMATAPFVLYHFNRFALLGLIANMAVIPLATFIIMPGMVLALLLMPLGLQWIGYIPLEWGTDMMIAMARWVNTLAYASLSLPSPTASGLAVAAFGIIWACFTTGRLRLFGALVVVAGLSTILQHVPVDVFISRDARQVMVRLPDDRYAALKGTTRSFAVQNWLRTEGQEELVPLKETEIECDKSLCRYQRNGHTLLLIKNTKDQKLIQRYCAQKSDVLVAWWYLDEETCAGPGLRIGRRELETHGAHVLWLDKDIRMQVTRESGEGRRPWRPTYNEESEAEE